MKKWFENLKISKKLIIGFLFVACLGVVIGLVGIINIINMNNSQQKTYDQCTLGIKYSTESEIDYAYLKTAVRDLYIHYSTNKEQYCQDISDHLDTVEQQLDNYSKTISDNQDQENYNAMKTAYEPYKKIVNNIVEAAESGKTAREILALIQNGASVAQSADQAFEAASTYNENLASERLSSDTDSASVAIVVMIAVIVLSFILALLLGRYISNMISKPVQTFADLSEMLAVGDNDVDKLIEEKDRLLKYRKDEVGTLALSFYKMIASITEQAQAVQAIADGNLTTVVTVRSEFDVLGKALSELVQKFHTLAVSIVSSADQVDTGAKQVADSSTALSQGATEQASSVEELTASLEEVTSQTTQNAQNAQTTDGLAKSIREDAESGNTQMEEMLRAMDEINTSSDNISKIIKVIEDIAFQTNILALNAAVEAARAGQYGKGFAVVAEEVRNLAAQSAKAAKGTTDLIENSIKKVKSGTKIANEAADALGKIVEGVSKVSDLVDAIAISSNEQSAALEQINQGIAQVSQVVQSNAASSEECAASSEELSSQADCLKTSVSIFKLRGDSCSTTSTAPRSGEPERKETCPVPTPEVALSGSGSSKY
ncbi:MAG: methyl-accepting chemotaxis protein [Intestinimonas sp.]|nr:methyl-accepting chemotaxis protein [Intestinimonas sp.]